MKRAPASLPKPALPRPAALGGRWFSQERCEFMVWAPSAKKVELSLASSKKLVPMRTDGSGYHWATAAGLKPGCEYFYRLDSGKERPDPASRHQPRGVHGPSAVVDTAFDWTDRGWKGVPLEQLVIYELHVGTFSKAGTFDGIIPELDSLAELGVTALCLMPIAQFPGSRNWGYDGVYPYAVQDSYGGILGLKRLIDAAHKRGLAVMLDVVYNHLGPEGNYAADFGPYSAGKTHWGEGMNMDGPGSDEVRRFFIESAVRWVDEFHVDGFRLDAILAIRDFSARPFVEELTVAVHELARSRGRVVNVLAEAVLNDPRVVTPSEKGGWGCDCELSKDFHHALHAALTGERAGFYIDYSGLPELAKSYRDAYAFVGQYSQYRGRGYGRAAGAIPGSRFVVFAKDHDEVGNRPSGERLCEVAGFEGAKLAAGAVAFSPYIPLLFMGEEYGEDAPFLYFTSHSDPGLAEAVQRGRREMYERCAWPRQESPDPNAAATFARSKLDLRLRAKGRHAKLRDFYRRILALRREQAALASFDRANVDVELHGQALLVRRRAGGEEAFFVLNFSDKPGRLRLALSGGWTKALDSAEPQWGGPGSFAADRLAGGPAELALAPRSVVLYAKSSGGS